MSLTDMRNCSSNSLLSRTARLLGCPEVEGCSQDSQYQLALALYEYSLSKGQTSPEVARVDAPDRVVHERSGFVSVLGVTTTEYIHLLYCDCVDELMIGFLLLPSPTFIFSYHSDCDVECGWLDECL